MYVIRAFCVCVLFFHSSRDVAQNLPQKKYSIEIRVKYVNVHVFNPATIRIRLDAFLCLQRTRKYFWLQFNFQHRDFCNTQFLRETFDDLHKLKKCVSENNTPTAERLIKKKHPTTSKVIILFCCCFSCLSIMSVLSVV